MVAETEEPDAFLLGQGFNLLKMDPDFAARLMDRFQGRAGQVVLDKIRTVDKTRLARKLGRVSGRTRKRVLETLQEMFAL